jgi:hypothetical protein
VEDQGGGVTAAAMRRAIDSLRAAFTVADSLLRSAEHAGMEVSQAQFELQNAQTALLQARTAVHTFETDSVGRHGRRTRGTDTRSRGNEGLRICDSGSRPRSVDRHGVLLIGALVLKIWQLERRV